MAYGAAPIDERLKHTSLLSLRFTREVDRAGFRAAIETAWSRLAATLGGEVQTSAGSIGALPGDGFTEYFDARVRDGVVWTYYGHDYGHPFEAELCAKSKTALAGLRDAVIAALAPEVLAEPKQEAGMVPRADA